MIIVLSKRNHGVEELGQACHSSEGVICSVESFSLTNIPQDLTVRLECVEETRNWPREWYMTWYLCDRRLFEFKSNKTTKYWGVCLFSERTLVVFLLR